MSNTSSVTSTDPECLPKCRSLIHGTKIVSALTKRSEIELLVYIRHICSNYARVTDKLGRNALHMAASCGQIRVLEWLLTKDHCDPNIKDHESGWTSLHRSLFYGQLNAAKILIDHGANLEIGDNDGISPLDIVIKDRLPYVEYSLNEPCEVYVWGSNTNFNLGHEKQQNESIPKSIDLFKREKLSIKQVVMCKYHSVFLTDVGKVFSCGHGFGGRLGHDEEVAILAPKQIKALNSVECIQIAASTDHTVFLTSNGSIYTCGLNTFHQLGHYPPPDRVLSPRMIRNFKECLTGIVTSRFHTVAYSKNSLYTFGLNGGQLGHIKTTKTEINPKSVSAINFQTEKLALVCASNGATVFTTDKGNVYVLNRYQCLKIISKQSSIASVAAIGGYLDLEGYQDLKDNYGGQELKVVLLYQNGKIYIWQESSNQLIRCLFSTTRQLFVSSFSLSANSLIFLTRDGEGYVGKFVGKKKKTESSETSSSPLTSAKKEKRINKEELANEFTIGRSSLGSNKFKKNSEFYSDIRNSDSGKKYHASRNWKLEFLDVNACEKISVERLPGIHRALDSSCDDEGKNFAIVQGNPSTGVLENPVIGPSSLTRQLKELLDDANEYDNIHDVMLKVGDVQFPAHRYILACRSEYFSKLFLSKLNKISKTVCNNTVVIENIHPDIFAQFLKFIYTNSCDFFQIGYRLPLRYVYSVKEKIDKRSQNRRESIKEKEYSGKISKFFINDVKEAATKLGFHSLLKIIDTICIADEVVIETSTPKKGISFNRKKHPHLYDVGIICEDGVELKCHKCILASRLEYFNGMFANEWIESTVSESLHLPFPSSVLEVTIDYLYTDEAPRLQKCEDADFLCKMLLVCDHLLIDRLKEICESALAQLITLKNATEFLEFAYLCNAKQLQTRCMEFISVNLSAILDNRSLDVLSEEVIDMLTTSYRNMIPAMEYRCITPYADSPTDEEIEIISRLRPPISPDDLDNSLEHQYDNSRSSRKQKIKRKPRIHKNSQTICSPILKSPETIEDEIVSTKQQSIESRTPSKPIPISTKADHPAHPKLTQARSFEFESVPWSGKLSSEDSSLDLKEIMIQQELENRKNPAKSKISNDFKKTTKLSQKQKMKMLTNSNDVIKSPSPSDEITGINRNAWIKIQSGEVVSFSAIMKLERNKNQPVLSPTSATSERIIKLPSPSPENASPRMNPWSPPTPFQPIREELKFDDIVNAEQAKIVNLKKIQTKPLRLIQIEEQAIEELTKYYSLADMDEVVTVQRILPENVAVPVWKVAHK